MRRFERRGTEAPMDFSYEREDRDLGLFNDAIQRQKSPPFTAPSMGAVGRFPNGGGQAFASPSPFSNSPAAFPLTPTRAMSQQFEPPGSFEPQRTMAYQPPEIQDVSMSSDVPSPQKADDDMLVANEDEPPSPSKSKSGKSSGAGKLIRRLMGGKPSKSRGRPEGTSDTERTRRRRRRRDSDSSDNDAEDEGSPYPKSHVPAVYNVTMAPPRLAPGEFSHELSSYVRFIFMTIALSFCALVSYNFLMMVRDDVEAKVSEYSSELLHEINLCSQLYLVNKCHPETRIPAMENTCQNWERCMNKDPKVVSRVRVWAETLGDMFNGFVEPIAWKTLAFVVIGLSAIAFTAWILLRLFGNSNHPPPPQYAPHSYPMLPPSTPSHHYPGTPLGVEGRQLPPPGEWVREWSQGPISPPQTPRRRTAF